MLGEDRGTLSVDRGSRNEALNHCDLFLSLLSSNAPALEKYTVPADDSRIDSWNAGATCRVSYYNICTGWIWCWSGFQFDSRFGLVVDQCCPSGSTASLLSTTIFLCDEAHVGYGATGTIAVHAVDANLCPIGTPIAIQKYLPLYTTYPFSVVSWGGVQVPETFAIVVTTHSAMQPSAVIVPPPAPPDRKLVAFAIRPIARFDPSTMGRPRARCVPAVRSTTVYAMRIFSGTSISFAERSPLIQRAGARSRVSIASHR